MNSQVIYRKSLSRSANCRVKLHKMMNSQVIYFAMLENPALAPSMVGEFLKLSPEDWEIAEVLKNFGSNAEFMQEFLAHCPSCETLRGVFQKYRGTLACFDDLKALVLENANAEELFYFMRDVNGFATEDVMAAFFDAGPDIETLRIAARGVFDSLEISCALRAAFFAANPSEEQRKLFEFENSYRD